ncbi:MAG: hypothetical protein IT430_01200 [Phycisphaerales bacterium]|nr:hypothetical protein [Phycisphaerales bacterium]
MSQFDAGGMDPYRDHGGEPPRTSLLAVSGFVCSVIICCPLTSLLGLLMGVGGLLSVSSSNGRRKGTGLAAAAIIISILSLAGQALLMQWVRPYAQEYWKMFTLVAQGPKEFISDVQIGDFASARTHLYAPVETQVSDAQLQAFADEVTARYGSVQQGIQSSSTNQPIGGSGVGEQSMDVRSQLVFSKKTLDTTMTIKLLVGPNGRLEQVGIARIVLHDPDLGDLIFDENAAEAPVSGAEPAPPGEDEEPAPPGGEGGG